MTAMTSEIISPTPDIFRCNFSHSSALTITVADGMKISQTIFRLTANQRLVSLCTLHSQRVKYLNWMKQTKAAVIVQRPMANDNREVIRFQRLSFRSTWPTHLLPSPVARRITAELRIYGVYFRILEDEDKCTYECVRIPLILDMCNQNII